MDLTETIIPTRQSLLSRIRDWGDSVSWQDFYQTYHRLIFATAREAGLTADEAEEVVQETMICVSKTIREFRYNPGQGSFKSWLRTTTIWRIRDHLRRKQRLKTESLDAQNGDRDWPIAKNWDEAWEENLAMAALDRVKRKVAPQHFQVFDLAVMKGWETARIAGALRVSMSYVYVTKHRVAASVRRELRKLRRKPCQVSEFPALQGAPMWGAAAAEAAK